MTDAANSDPKRKTERKENITSLTRFNIQLWLISLMDNVRMGLYNAPSISTGAKRQWNTDSVKSSMIFCFSLISSRRRPSCLLCASRCDSICCSRALWGAGRERHAYAMRAGWRKKEVVPGGGNKKKTGWLNNKRVHLHTRVHLWANRPTGLDADGRWVHPV